MSHTYTQYCCCCCYCVLRRCHGSVGFYQVTKLLCIPAMVVIQSYFYQLQFSAKVKLALVVVLAGVGAATVSDVELNTVGCVMGALAVLFTAQFQIWQGDKQKVHKMNAMQMNHAQALPSFAFCLLLSLLVDHRGDTPDNNVRLHAMQTDEMAWIGISCVLALSVNLCTYGLIGKTSAVTYQVVGHAKVGQSTRSRQQSCCDRLLCDMCLSSIQSLIHPPVLVCACACLGWFAVLSDLLDSVGRLCVLPSVHPSQHGRSAEEHRRHHRRSDRSCCLLAAEDSGEQPNQPARLVRRDVASIVPRLGRETVRHRVGGSQQASRSVHAGQDGGGQSRQLNHRRQHSQRSND